MKKVIFSLLLGVGLWNISTASYVLAKAELSQFLIKDAWQKTIKSKKWHKPWSWADTHPIFKLSFPRLDKESYVLEGSSGRNLAFSSTHLQVSGMPNDNKTTIVSGHRDSHFSYLGKVEMGDLIVTQSVNHEISYRVNKIKIIDSKKHNLLINRDNKLVLTTCYPFDSLTAGGSLRYVIYASPI